MESNNRNKMKASNMSSNLYLGLVSQHRKKQRCTLEISPPNNGEQYPERSDKKKDKKNAQGNV